ncbi:MAG: NTP transferase domain-containing protein [Nannocystaceae bacterium]|nr:nucleotidyltransferase family protein [bacterium]
MILAAGASTRMGRPKALIEWQGRPFFMHCAQRAAAAGCSPRVVVWGATALPERSDVVLVENPRWQDGPLSSLQRGLEAVLPGEPSGVLVMTVDRPHVRPPTLEALLEAHAKHPEVLVQPRLGETSGHPLLYPVGIAAQLLALEPTGTVRTVLHSPQVRGRRVRVAVDDPAVLDNLDSPGALARLPSR